MLSSIAYILLFGMFLGTVFQKLKLPKLLGMIIAGMLIGPYLLNLLDDSILNISSQIRQIALIIILTRAGLTLDLNDLKKVGRPAILMCFVPACFEIIGMILIAPKLLGISLLEAAILGSVIAAVSPAVVVPKMIQLIDSKLGTNKAIPQMILAGASVDDVFVIVLFSAFTNLAKGQTVSIMNFASVPISIFTGILFGYLTGVVVNVFLNKTKLNPIQSFMFVLSISFMLMQVQTWIEAYIPFSGLLSIMAMGLAINKVNLVRAKSLNAIYNKSWEIAQIFLFVLVGASVNLPFALKAGPIGILVIVLVMGIRMMGVFVCLLKTPLKEDR
ncbi:MAG: cation:proton antiporter, partial [Holdemanella sp.]|nr:cation:proton antiporter [Holdemanella sp.]